MEIRWNENSDGDYTGRELEQLGTDLVYNVRDRDSDNDGIIDGDEIGWNETNDGQGLDENDDRENMIDPDSDGDGIWDGWEIDYYSDYDGDGLENGIDPDSDNDGLCDGWADQYIWDPYSSRFVHITASGKVYSPSSQTNGSFDPWEGEDWSRDGVLNDNETDPHHPDTDCDGLWDGWDIVIDGEVKRGELYDTGNTAFDSLMQVQGFDYNRDCGNNWEQSGSTDPLDPDSDDDGLADGDEVNGWGISISIRYVDNTTKMITETIISDIRSDPTNDDLDGDGMLDGDEFNNGTLPYENDTDHDGLDDLTECGVWNTDPTDFDTDKDFLPDGWIDGWHRVNETTWMSNRENTTNSIREVWEGEDLDNSGTLGSLESDPRYPDTDNDGLIDGYEYFFINISVIMSPWSLIPGTNRYYYDFDNDGYPNARDNDSDSDGIMDGDEDRNGDGKLDARLDNSTYPFYTYAKESNPFDNDSDDDGLIDGEDLLLDDILYYLADPDNDGCIPSMDRDSDNDSLGDKYEYDNYPTQHPLKYGDQDSDGDGLTYDMEQNLSLDDNDEDCDGDGLSDGDEVLLHGTDPLKADMDGDGLSDGFEVYTSKTDPLDPDSDDDGLSDALEYNNSDTGLDPNDNDVDKDGLLDGNPFEGVMGFDGQVKPRSEWLNSDEDFESILGEPFMYNFNDTDSDGDGLKDGYELGITDNHDNIIGDRNKSIISGDTDNDRIVDLGEEWLNTNPLNFDTDGDNIPDGWIDGWTRRKDGTWHLDKSLRDGVKDLHEGESIRYDGTVTFTQREINTKSGTKTDSDGDTLPDWLERWMRSNPNNQNMDGDCVPDNLDLEPSINGNISFSFFLKSFFVMDDTSLDFPNDKPDPLFTCDIQSRGTFTDSWKDSDHGGAKIAQRKVENGYCNDPCDQYGSDYLYTISRGFVVQHLPWNHYQLLFTVRMYDKDLCSADDQIDISPCSSYTLEVFYDVVTGMWAVWDDMAVIKETTYNTYLNNPDNLKEGVYIYKNQNDSYTVIRETEKGKPVAGIGDGIGYVTGFEPGSKDLKEAGGIQFEIAPMYLPEESWTNYEEYDYYCDYDYDGLTTLTERFWLSNTIYYDNRPLNYGTLNASLWDSDGDNVGDGWEIRYGFDPCDKTSPNKNDDGDQDGISDYNEYCLEDSPLSFDRRVTIKKHNMAKWGAQPDRKDIFVEVDWMKDGKKEYKMSGDSKTKVILAFFKACKYGQHITLHIDDGCMGGGGDKIYYQPKSTKAEINTIETTYHDYDDIFVYVMCIGDSSEHDGRGVSWDEAGAVLEYGVYSSFDDRLYMFAHELGHCLGIGEHDDNRATGKEVYCSDDNCFMNDETSYYCDDCFDDMFEPLGAWADPTSGIEHSKNDQRIFNKRSVTGEDG